MALQLSRSWRGVGDTRSIDTVRRGRGEARGDEVGVDEVDRRASRATIQGTSFAEDVQPPPLNLN